MTKDAELTPADRLAAGAHAGQPVDGFGPIWNTALLQLARASWKTTGLEPFLQYQVPHTATSSGRLSEDALDVVLQAVSGRQIPEGGYRFLELGSGSGLFAKLFLDRLKTLAPDIYANAQYYVTDGANSVLASQRDHGILDAHLDRVIQLELNAEAPFPDDLKGSLDFVFATYLLDSLAFDILAINDKTRWQLEARSIYSGKKTNVAQGLKRALSSTDSGALKEFADVGHELFVQTRFARQTSQDLPFHDRLPDQTDGETIPFLHSFGAMACVEQCIAALRPGGAVIFNDYGWTEQPESLDEVEFQTFGNTVAYGVNFHQFDAHFPSRRDVHYIRPQEEEGSLFTRVIAHPDCPDLSDIVDHLYGSVRYRAMTLPMEAARALLPARLFEKARRLYGISLDLEPRNWALLEEIATFFLLPSGDADSALAFAEEALKINPIGPGIWRVKGEALVHLDRLDEAMTAFQHALRLHPMDAHTYLAIAHLKARTGDENGALADIAQGLVADTDGDLRDGFKDLQDQVLMGLSGLAAARLRQSVNRFRHPDKLPMP